MKNKPLLYYVFGFLTSMVLIPILDEFMNVILSWIEVLKIKPMRIVTEWNKEVNAESDEDGVVQAIGFHYTPQDEEYEYYDDGE